MLEIQPVNLVQAGGLSISLFGLYLLKEYAHYFMVRYLLLFSALSAITNFSEEVLGSRAWHLISPIYIVGLGPIFYLCVHSLAHADTDRRQYLHFMPMLLALPFTQYTQVIIALGTVSFAVYAVAIYRQVKVFESHITQQRSNAQELSLNWFLGLIYATAAVYVMDLTRLNLQPHISYFANLTGQLVGTIAIYLILALLVKKLLQFSDELLSFRTEEQVFQRILSESDNGTSEDMLTNDIEKNTAEYKSLFQHIQSTINDKALYRQPRLSLMQLSAETGLQTRDISRAINLCARMNFNDFINTLRVDAIKLELKTESHLSLLEIGLQGGFNSKTSFNNVFKRLTGMTPGQFRANSH